MITNNPAAPPPTPKKVFNCDSSIIVLLGFFGFLWQCSFIFIIFIPFVLIKAWFAGVGLLVIEGIKIEYELSVALQRWVRCMMWQTFSFLFEITVNGKAKLDTLGRVLIGIVVAIVVLIFTNRKPNNATCFVLTLLIFSFGDSLIGGGTENEQLEFQVKQIMYIVWSLMYIFVNKKQIAENEYLLTAIAGVPVLQLQLYVSIGYTIIAIAILIYHYLSREVKFKSVAVEEPEEIEDSESVITEDDIESQTNEIPEPLPVAVKIPVPVKPEPKPKSILKPPTKILKVPTRVMSSGASSIVKFNISNKSTNQPTILPSATLGIPVTNKITTEHLHQEKGTLKPISFADKF